MTLNQRGQAVTEYVLLMITILFFIRLLFPFWQKYSPITLATQNLFKPLQSSYQFGDPQAHGYDGPGDPQRHPRIPLENNFRLIINPKPL